MSSSVELLLLPLNQLLKDPLDDLEAKSIELTFIAEG